MESSPSEFNWIPWGMIVVIVLVCMQKRKELFPAYPNRAALPDAFRPTPWKKASPPQILWFSDAQIPQSYGDREAQIFGIQSHLTQRLDAKHILVSPTFPYTSQQGNPVYSIKDVSWIASHIQEASLVMAGGPIAEVAAKTAAAAERPLLLWLEGLEDVERIERILKVYPRENLFLVAPSRWLVDVVAPLELPVFCLHPSFDWKTAQTTPIRRAISMIVETSEEKAWITSMAQLCPEMEWIGVNSAPSDSNVSNLRQVARNASMTQVYAQTGIWCVPFVRWAWDRAAAEALASGIPVIAHPAVAHEELFGKDAQQVAHEDKEAWATLLRELQKDRAQQERASQKAFARSQGTHADAEFQQFFFWIGQIRWTPVKK